MEQEFWYKFNLGSDLIQKVTKKKCIFDEFPELNEDELYFGVDGKKHVVYKHFGNVSFAYVFENHLGDFNFVGFYYNQLRDQFKTKDMVKEFVESLKNFHENPEIEIVVEKEEKATVQKATEELAEIEQPDVKFVDDVSMNGNLLS